MNHKKTNTDNNGKESNHTHMSSRHCGTISRSVNANRPKTHYLIGLRTRLLVFLHSILPARCFSCIMLHAS
ncbi:MAG: hypothetical protein HXN40_10950 [Prevotella histicola]|uniref:hypothetical protein n=1 Tax=Prevotella histicola TaxID=470565 RepID=UPI001CB51365|nr:hypothetical protein [Prevotella histicola]MBF1424076.1 hypothetical protein [Prevotella histicola]